LAAAGGERGKGGGVGDGDGEGKKNGVAIVLPGVECRVTTNAPAKQFTVPSFEKFDMLKQGKRPSGAAAGKAGEVKSGISSQGKTPVDEANRIPAVENVVRTEVSMDEGEGSFSETA
jgi:hypothetical protein